MSTIGQILTAARDRAGYTIAELSSRTCIRESVLRGMERDDFAPCGADFYARGHIKAVCRELAVDPAELLHRYEEEHARVPQQASASDDAEQTVAAARAGLDGRAEEQRRGLFAPLRDAVADALHPHGDRTRADGQPGGEQGEVGAEERSGRDGSNGTGSAGAGTASAPDGLGEGGTPAVPAQSAPGGGDRGSPQDSAPGSAGGSSPRGPIAGAAEDGALPGASALGGYGSGAALAGFGAGGAAGAAGASGGSHPLGAEPGPRADGRAPDDWRDAVRGPEARPSGAVQGEHALRDLFAGAGWAASPEDSADEVGPDSADSTDSAAGREAAASAASAAEADTVDLTGRADTLDLSDALDAAAAEGLGGASAAGGKGRTRSSGDRKGRAGRRPSDRRDAARPGAGPRNRRTRAAGRAAEQAAERAAGEWGAGWRGDDGVFRGAPTAWPLPAALGRIAVEGEWPSSALSDAPPLRGRRRTVLRRAWPLGVAALLIAGAVIAGVRAWPDAADTAAAGTGQQAGAAQEARDAKAQAYAAAQLRAKEEARREAQDLRTAAVERAEASASGTVAEEKRPEKVTVRMTAERRTWVSVTGHNGETVYTGAMKKGESREWSDEKELHFHVGNTAGVRMEVNGVDQGSPGTRGEVKRFTVSTEDVEG